MLSQKDLNNVEIQLIVPTETDIVPSNLRIEKFEFTPKEEFSNYFNKVLDFDNDFFDFILIDGRARVECLYNSIPKLKSGGMMILDNSERERYKPVFSILNDWDMVFTTNGLTDTTIWFKP